VAKLVICIERQNPFRPNECETEVALLGGVVKRSMVDFGLGEAGDDFERAIVTSTVDDDDPPSPRQFPEHSLDVGRLVESED